MRKLMLLLLAVMLIGCSKDKLSSDPAFARKVADAVYAGSLAPIRDSFSPEFMLNDAWAKQMGDTLKSEFGAIEQVTLNSMGQGTATSKEMIWNVTTENSQFLMQLIFDENDKLMSIEFNY